MTGNYLSSLLNEYVASFIDMDAPPGDGGTGSALFRQLLNSGSASLV